MYCLEGNNEKYYLPVLHEMYLLRQAQQIWNRRQNELRKCGRSVEDPWKIVPLMVRHL